MGEFIGHHAAGGLFLEAVVAYCGCGIYCGGDVALVDQVALLGGIAPDAGEAIGLQFEKHGELIGGAGIALLFGADGAFDAEDFLDVVADFVGDDVGLREFA